MATLVLTVNGEGTDASGWVAEGGNYTRLQTDDGDASRLYSPINGQVRQLTLTNTSGLSGTTINSVTVYAKYRSLDPVSNTFQLGVRTGGADYWSPSKDTVNSTTYSLFSHSWSTNPDTSSAWTVAELDALEIGIKKSNPPGGAVTYMYAEVDYSETAEPESKSGSGALSATGALAASSTINLSRATTLSGVGTFPASGSVQISRTGTLSATGTLTGSGSASETVVGSGTGTLSATGTLTGAGAPALSGAGAFSGAGTLSGGGTSVLSGAGAFSGAGTLSGSGTSDEEAPALNGVGSLAGTGTLSGSGSPKFSRSASFSGTGILFGTPFGTRVLAQGSLVLTTVVDIYVAIEAAQSEATAAQDDAAAAVTAAGEAQLAANQAADAADAANTLAGQTATDLQELADVKSVIFQTEAPPGRSDTLWIDTDTGQPFQWSGTQWVLVTDSRITDAASAASTAQDDANAAATAAALAQAEATAAAEAAGLAQADATQAISDAAAAAAAAAAAESLATDAMISANGRNSRVISLSSPFGAPSHPETGNPLVHGDTWWQWDDGISRNVIGAWVWDVYQNDWLPELIGHETISSMDINKLVVTGSALLAQAIVEKIVGDAAHFGLFTTDLLIAGEGNINELVTQQFATALASIIEARIENLVVTEGANINVAVIQKIAANMIISGEFKTLIDEITGVFSTMDGNGFRVVDTDGPDNNGEPTELIRLGPDVNENLFSLGGEEGSVTIDSKGGVSARVVSAGEFWLNGNRMSDNLNAGPRGIVSWGQLFGGYSRQLQGRDQVIGLEASLAPGRVYRLYSSSAVVQTQNIDVIPFLQLHRTLDGSYPGDNWGASAVSESIIGPYGGFRSLPGMEVFIDRRDRPLTEAPTLLRAGLSLGNLLTNGWAQVAATVHRTIIAVEDLGTNFPDRGTPYFDAGGGGSQPIRTRQVQRWHSTGWANYIVGGGRDYDHDKPWQGLLPGGATQHECFFFFDDMTSALAGAVIHRITLHTFADYWYNSWGGTASWGWHAHIGGIPETGQFMNHMNDTLSWPRGASRDLHLNSGDFGAWQSGARRGFGFSTTSTDPGFHGHFSPLNSATFIEVDYER